MSKDSAPAAAADGHHGRLVPVLLFLVAPVLLLPGLTDHALARWLLVASGLALAAATNREVAAAMAAHLRELWPLLGLVLIIAGHMLHGAAVAEGARWLVLVVVGGFVYLYCRGLSPGEQDHCLRLLAFAGAAVGAYALVQVAGLDLFHYPAESWMYRVVTTFGHRNFTASFLLVALLCALGVRGRRDAHGQRLPAWPLVLCYLGLLATASRLPIAMATLALLLHLGRRRRAVVMVLVGAAAALWLAAIAARGELSRVITRTETISLRRELYLAQMPLMVKQPIFGLGPGGFANHIPLAMAERGVVSEPGLVFLHAHNLPSEVIIDFGWVGLLLAAAFVLPAYWSAFARGPGRAPPVAWAHLCLVVVNLYDVSFFSYAGWVGFWPLLAFMRPAHQGPVPAPRTARLPLRIAVTTVMVAVIVVLVMMIRSSRMCHAAAMAQAQGRGATAAELYHRAEQLFPLPLGEQYRAALAAYEGGAIDQAALRLQAVESVAPGFSAVRYNLAMVAAERGRRDDAHRWLQLHLRLYPEDPAAAAAAERLRQEGDDGKALAP